MNLYIKRLVVGVDNKQEGINRLVEQSLCDFFILVVGGGFWKRRKYLNQDLNEEELIFYRVLGKSLLGSGNSIC